MNCPFCEVSNQKEIPEFNATSAHLIAVVSQSGAVHVHAPFESPAIMLNLIEKIVIEAEKHGVVYKPRTNNKGD